MPSCRRATPGRRETARCGPRRQNATRGRKVIVIGYPANRSSATALPRPWRHWRRPANESSTTATASSNRPAGNAAQAPGTPGSRQPRRWTGHRPEPVTPPAGGPVPGGHPRTPSLPLWKPGVKHKALSPHGRQPTGRPHTGRVIQAKPFGSLREPGQPNRRAVLLRTADRDGRSPARNVLLDNHKSQPSEHRKCLQ